MGYKAPKKTYNLDFEGTGYDGLLVSLHGLTTGRFLEMQRLVGVAESSVDAAGKLFESFETALVSWNQEDDDDRPIPVSHQAVMDLDLTMVLDIVKAWISAVASVPEELGKGSTSGQRFPEVNLPMEALSPSLVS